MIADPILVDSALALVQQATPVSSGMSNILPAEAGFDFDLIRLLRGLLGMGVLVGIAWAFSSNRKAVSWTMVGRGLAFQLILAVGILYVPCDSMVMPPFLTTFDARASECGRNAIMPDLRLQPGGQRQRHLL